MSRLSPKRRLLRRSAWDGEHLVWTGPLDRHGRAQVTVDGRRTYAHVLAWEQFRGPVPEGRVVRRVCDRPGCVRPDPGHLELSSRSAINADSRRRVSAARTTCSRGHELTPENTYEHLCPDGGLRRQCRTCKSERSAELRARRRAESKETQP